MLRKNRENILKKRREMNCEKQKKNRYEICDFRHDEMLDFLLGVISDIETKQILRTEECP